MASPKQSILPVLWGAKMLGHQLKDQDGPRLGEGLLRVLELHLQTPQPDPAIRASSADAHPASDSNPTQSCDYLLHTFLLLRTLLPCWIYESPNRQHFVRLGLGCHSAFHFTLLSQVQGYKDPGVKSYGVLPEPWSLSFLVLGVPHKCKVTYSLIFFTLQLQLSMFYVFKAHIRPRMKTKVKGHVKGDISA